MDISLSSGLGAGGVTDKTVVSSGVFSSMISTDMPIDSYVRGGGAGAAGGTGEGSCDVDGDTDAWRLDKREALILSSSLSEKSLSVTVMIEWKSSMDSVGVGRGV